MTQAPALPDVGVLAFVPDEWEIPWQPRHQVLTRLARYFHVVWVTPAPWWRDLLHAPDAHRMTANAPAKNGVPHVNGFHIFRPPKWLPVVGRPQFLADWTMQGRMRRALEILEERGCTKRIVYIWRPSFADAVDAVPHDLSCYHIDDEYSFSKVEKPVDPIEARLISRVDQVIIHSPALVRKKGHLNPNMVRVPNGVDYETFRAPRPEPADLASVPHPRIGYVGRIKEQLDLSLLRTLANRHPELSFVLVGPVELDPGHTVMGELQAISNVHLLGSKPVSLLPAYMQHLDVCLLCYNVDDYTKFIYPLKLHEYLATGRPVVGTPIDSLLEFGDVVRLARTADEWSDALRGALSDQALSAAETERRREVARQHDWNHLTARIATALADRLGESYRARLGNVVDLRTSSVSV